MSACVLLVITKTTIPDIKNVQKELFILVPTTEYLAHYGRETRSFSNIGEKNHREKYGKSPGQDIPKDLSQLDPAT